MIHKILSLDQAATCGFAVLEDGKLIDYGRIKAKGANYHEKIAYLKHEVLMMIDEHAPDAIVLEDVFKGGLNIATYGKLSGMLHVLKNCAMELDIPAPIIAAGTWRSQLGLITRPREKAKEESIAYANEKYGLRLDSDDVADAINLGTSFYLLLLKEREANG
jgi:Holliday junction resolvasome RuvABC endonuclease subunit